MINTYKNQKDKNRDAFDLEEYIGQNMPSPYIYLIKSANDLRTILVQKFIVENIL